MIACLYLCIIVCTCVSSKPFPALIHACSQEVIKSEHLPSEIIGTKERALVLFLGNKNERASVSKTEPSLLFSQKLYEFWPIIPKMDKPFVDTV